MRLHHRLIFITLCTLLTLPLTFAGPIGVLASAGQYISASTSSVKPGDIVSFYVSVNTAGKSENSFESTMSWSASVWQPVQGTYAGSICNLPVTQPTPIDSGTAGDTACGTSGGFNGTGVVYTVKLQLASTAVPGPTSITLSDCTVLRNDGFGTNDTGGCSGTSITVLSAPTPVPIIAATKPPATPTPTPRPTLIPATAKPPPGKTPAPAETPHEGVVSATTTPVPPAVQGLPATTATPATAAGGDTSTPATGTTEKRTIGTAFTDLFKSLKQLPSAFKDFAGLTAILVTIIPILLLILLIIFFIYRLYVLERRRRRTLDRLFEMELGELAALEGKLDLLAEKGNKGREEYREEFQASKEKILRQLRPDYGKPVDEPKKVAKAEPPSGTPPA